MADTLLRNVEFRPVTEIIFHSMTGNRHHGLGQDVRRLRLRALPNHTIGKLDLFSRVPSDSINR